MNATAIIKVGVQTLVIREQSLLLGRRKNCFGAGMWGLPGGHLEIGETIRQAAIRELREETGLTASDVAIICVTDPDPKTNHHMQVGVEVIHYSGTHTINEPERCDALDFFPFDCLPKPLFPGSEPVIQNYFRKSFYFPLD